MSMAPARERPTVVTVYPMTGKQFGPISVPHAICRECDLTIRLARAVAADLPGVEVRIRPWFRYLLSALRRGGWHPPVVTVNGRIFSQGIVPDEDELRRALARSAPAS